MLRLVRFPLWLLFKSRTAWTGLEGRGRHDALVNRLARTEYAVLSLICGVVYLAGMHGVWSARRRAASNGSAVATCRSDERAV